MDDAFGLVLAEEARARVWQQVIDAIEQYERSVGDLRVAPLAADLDRAVEKLTAFDFAESLEPDAVVRVVIDALRTAQIHASNPRYLGLFHPRPVTMGVVAETLAAAFNSQLAGWTHCPIGVSLEHRLIRQFCEKFGYDASTADGSFTSGGAESNHTAVLCGLIRTFPQFATKGLRGLSHQPVLYVSAQGHQSFVKAARFCGLGTDAVRSVPVNGHSRMNVQALIDQIDLDTRRGFAPFLVVGSAGTTATGAVDALADLADVAAERSLWLHVDAAWGGAVALVPELRSILDGVERSDSITLDAHKWLSTPIGASMILTRHADILGRTCHVATDFTPGSQSRTRHIDPFTHSLQWSRRFIGLKLFMALAVSGWRGYTEAIRHQIAMGARLREMLVVAGWRIVNSTPLPLVCFVDTEVEEGDSAPYLKEIVQHVVASGRAWLSFLPMGNTAAIRACITNLQTAERDLDAVVHVLDAARQHVRRSHGAIPASIR